MVKASFIILNQFFDGWILDHCSFRMKAMFAIDWSVLHMKLVDVKYKWKGEL